MDKQLEITVIQDSKFGWREQGDNIILYAKSHEKDQVHSLLADYYLSKAKYILHNKTIDLVTRLNWQHKLTDIRFRRTKTKWGHCTATGRIQYNWLILMAPESVINYLIAHEVSHLIHLNHSAQFWQQVQEIHPSYKRDRQWLNDHGHTLTL
jgi:predicted metal-dependent hydrolase